VVTNIGDGDHLGLSDINTRKVAKVKRCIVEAVAPTGYAVLNANDPLVVEMAAHCPGGVVFFASIRLIRLFCAIVAWAAERFCARRKRRSCRGQPRRDGHFARSLALDSRWQVAFQVENSLAAIAAAWSLGIGMDLIRARAESMAADIDKVPGRFNFWKSKGPRWSWIMAQRSLAYGGDQAIGNFPPSSDVSVHHRGRPSRPRTLFARANCWGPRLTGSFFTRTITRVAGPTARSWPASPGLNSPRVRRKSLKWWRRQSLRDRDESCPTR